MTSLEVLVAGRALIADPARWVQWKSAVRSGGSACTANDHRAVRWCSDGALTNVAPLWTERMGAVLALGAACGVDGIIRFNDRNSHAEVLAAWDRAIAMVKASDGH